MMGRENEAGFEGAEVMRIDPEFSLERFIKSLPYDQSKKRSNSRRPSEGWAEVRKLSGR
jgi:hypothetical protein